MITLKTYKGIELKYDEHDRTVVFNFEGKERKVNYLFEATNIIDAPVYEPCSVAGYFKEGYIDSFIGIAKADRRNIKNGEYEWKTKGQYDLEFRINPDRKVYIKNEKTDDIYRRWKEQKEIYLKELNKLNKIASELKTCQ